MNEISNVPPRDDELGRLVTETFTEQAIHNVSAYARLGADGYTAIEAYHGLSRRTAAGALLRIGGHFQRLALLQDITDHYCDSIGLRPADVPYYDYFKLADPNVSALQETRRCYEAAVLLDGESPEIRFCLATVQRAQGEGKAAIANFESAARLKPAFAADSFWNIACILEDSGQRNAAVEYFRKAARQRDTFGGMHIRLSRLLRQSGAVEESLDHFEKTMTFGHTWLPEYHLAAASADEVTPLVAGVDGYDLFRARGRMHAVPSALSPIGQDDLSGRALRADGWRRWVDAVLLAMPGLFRLTLPILQRYAPGTVRRILRHRVRSGPTVGSIGMAFSAHLSATPNRHAAPSRHATPGAPANEPVIALNEHLAGYSLFQRGRSYYAAPSTMGPLTDLDIAPRDRRRGGWRDVADDFFFALPLVFRLSRPLLMIVIPGVVRRVECRHIRNAGSLAALKDQLGAASR